MEADKIVWFPPNRIDDSSYNLSGIDAADIKAIMAGHANDLAYRFLCENFTMRSVVFFWLFSSLKNSEKS
jgi:hypothetical protein